MKLLLPFLLLLSIGACGQVTYTPGLQNPVNKAIAPALALPTDARSYFYDPILFKARPYNGKNEVYSYLNTASFRTGQFPVVVNETGTLQPNGSYLDSTVSVYWFKNGTKNTDLILMIIDTANTFNDIKDTVYAFTTSPSSITIHTGLAYDPASYSISVTEQTTTGDIAATKFKIIYDSGQKMYTLQFTGLAPRVGTIYRYKFIFFRAALS